ncbi:MAG: substrate-binding domain-containing protein [Paracoccus sp. (in: a-proteobacteria)]|nr:substrate-binding domain-containing protein [Paracoccus sp. (in: a-proteobacteria)]
MKSVKITMSAIAVLASSAAIASARDYVSVAGSSTVLPYSNIVATEFPANYPEFAAPVVEGGGSGGGLSQFCNGVGENTIDIANASRPIRDGERETCAANGVEDIIEVRIGYDGIVFASDVNGPEFVLTPADIFNALGRNVVVDGEVVANPHTTWAQANADLPDQGITAFVPGTRHGTREVFEEKVLAVGCEESGAKAAFEEAHDADTAKEMCMQVRTDGRSVDIDGDYTETLARLDSDREAIGVFGLSFYENNTARLRVATIDGVTPSTETIASGEYPVSRPLFFYVKKAHIGVIPGLKEFAEFFVSDGMAGPDGPLAAYGLVADPELAETQAHVADEVVMN